MMVQVLYNFGENTVTVLYDFALTEMATVDVSQFNVVNTPQSITIATASTLGATLALNLGGDIPSQDFGIVYTPGTTGFLTAENGDVLGQIYYDVTIDSGGICLDACDDPGDTDPGPVTIKNVICLDEETIEIEFNRYISTNFIPGLEAFLLLDVPEGGGGNFTQLDIVGRSVLITHDFDFPLSGTSLQYLPPAANFLQTTDSPPVLILPFIIPVSCGDETGLGPCELQPQVHKNGVGTGYGTLVGELATINDYVLIYGKQEAIQASNDDNGGATQINEPRLQAELDHAAVLLNNYISIATWSGKALLAGSFKRTQLVITRYYLLNKSRPEVVREEFEKTLQWIETSAYSNANKFNPDCPETNFNVGTGGFQGSFDSFHGAGRVMSWGVTQQYRVEDGLGLRGWHIPTDGQDHLWRIQQGYYVPDYEKRRFIRGGA